MIDLLEGFVDDAEGLLKSGMLLLGIVFVGWTWWRTKALTSTMGALLFAAVIIWGINHFGTLSGVVDRDVNQRIGEQPSRPNSADPRASGD